MGTYVVLASFTDQGLRTVKDTTRRAEAVSELAQRYGVKAREFLWTLGQHDLVVIFEAPDDASMTALGLAVASTGNVRSQTLKAFSKDEMNAILGRLP